jgi:RNA polymerase sigma factor (sigma-70 family)
VSRSKVIQLRARALTAPEANDLNSLGREAAECRADLTRLLELLSESAALRILAARLAAPLASHGAEDLVQCTLERVCRGIRSYRGEGDLLGWVGRIMRNAQIELLRRESAEGVKRAGWALEPPTEPSPGPDELLDRQELRERLREAWQATRGDPDVSLFWDRSFAGLSVDQIVRRTGRPRSTVYLMLSRGAEKLRRELERRLGASRRGRGEARAE